MKRSCSSLLPALLLALFVVGGNVLPALHRVKHTRERYEKCRAAPHCTHEGHEAPVVERGAASTAMQPCWLCSTRPLMDATPAPVWEAALRRHEEERSTVVLRLHASRVDGLSVIRGPPRA